MSARSRLLAAAVAVALAAGCAHSDLKVPREVQPIAFLPDLTAAQTRGLTSVSWEPEGSAGPGDRLFVRVPAAICPRLRGVVVTDTPAAVTLQVFASIGHCSEGAAGYVSAPVRLPSPLGTRPLRHGPVVPPLPGISNGPPARRLIALRSGLSTHCL